MKPALYSVWHLNLMYSSIEIDRRAEVIEKCFWPLIDLAKKGFKPGIEAPAMTLEITQALDPAWIKELKECWEKGLLEFVGSGYSQLIAALVPATVNEANIKKGASIYEKFLGRSPKLWMANEQTYSKGVAENLIDANINQLIVDWCNPFSLHPEWQESLVFSPQKTKDTRGREINILWSDSLAFQKFQRCVHQENILEDYEEFLDKLLEKMKKTPESSFCIYGNDAEIFDFRPGRFTTEPTLGQSREWQTVQQTLGLMQNKGFEFILPSDCFKRKHQPQILELTNLADPNSVKKQPKYNVNRWSVTGRGSSKANQACFNLAKSKSDQKLCELWSSDFRTHITEKRWQDYSEQLSKLSKNFESANMLSARMNKAIESKTSDPEKKIFFETHDLKVCLNPLRGLSLEDIGLQNSESFLGRHHHGTFSRIDLSADWYTGNVVLQLPGKAQATDLKKAKAQASENESEKLFQTTIPFANGQIIKTLLFPKKGNEWKQEFHFQIPELPIGSLRFGFLCLKAPALKNERIKIKTHLGGKSIEEFIVPDIDFDHGQEASSLVSSTQALGMTEGIIQIIGEKEILTVEIESSTIRPVAMIENKMTREGRFFRLYFSVSEYDETRKGPFDFSNETVCFKYKLERR